MENASKALIIAGAILISIILIGIGILVINSMNPITDQATDFTDTAAIQTFNSSYEAYAGNKSASEVRSLMSQVTANNAQNPDRAITVTASGFAGNVSGTTGLGSITAGVNSQRRYQIVIEDSVVDGYYDSITITQQ